MSIRLLLFLAGWILTATGTPVSGAGPLLVDRTTPPLPVIWRNATSPYAPSSAIPYNPDLGGLGTQTEAQAQAIVSELFQVWQDVPTSVAAYVNSGNMPADVTSANYATYLDVSGDGLNPIVFDADGSIHDLLFGPGNSVLGFAGTVTYFPTIARISEGQAALNGRFIDGNAANGEVASLNVFRGTFVHEFGHYSGLDHTQVNNFEAFDGAADNDTAVPTMYPTNIFQGASTERISLNLDDVQGISALYPDASFVTNFGRITGTVFGPDQVSLQGVNVVARKLDDPRVTAASCVSGFLYQRFTSGVGSTAFGSLDTAYRGTFDIRGLPPGPYSLEMESLDQRFNGGSRIGPISPPISAGRRDLFNGFAESTDPAFDLPDDFVVVPVAAGQSVTGINLFVNRPTGLFEEFSAGGFDLSFSNLTYFPDANAPGGYRVRVTTGITGFPINPSGHTTHSLADNGSLIRNSGIGLAIPFFGAAATAVNICANGLITLGSPGTGESDSTPTSAELFLGNGKIAPFWTDLNPDAGAGGGGRISSALFTTGFCVTFENVPVKDSSIEEVSFQVFIEESTGNISITYLSCSSGRMTEVGIGTGGPGNSVFGHLRNFSALAGDTTAPTLSITSPVHRSEVSGSITFAASFSDPTPSSGQDAFVYYVDGQVVGVGLSSISVLTAAWVNGEHRLEVVGRDLAGNTTRTGVVVRFQNASAPTLRQRVFNYSRSGDQLTCRYEIINEGTVTATNLSLREFALEVTGTFAGTQRVFGNPTTGGLLPRTLASSLGPGGTTSVQIACKLPAGTNFVARWVTHGEADQGRF